MNYNKQISFKQKIIKKTHKKKEKFQKNKKKYKPQTLCLLRGKIIKSKINRKSNIKKEKTIFLCVFYYLCIKYSYLLHYLQL